MTARRQKFYPAAEIVALVQSLDRPQDNGLFSRDVLLVYPRIAEAYTKACPRRCDLETAAQKAANDAYGYDVKLTELREDVDLMVSNCLRFNGVQGPYADTARSFEKFAKQAIDAYVAQKTGGRRVSSLRLSAVGEAEGKGTRGKRQRDEAQLSQQKNSSNNNNNNNNTQGNTSSCTELVKLVDSLNRREDKGAFAVDVAEAYPELRKEYEATCPVKMNLIIAKERAASGFYLGLQHGQQQQRQRGSEVALSSVLGSSVAESLVLLREDVELMVSNCIRFNAKVQAWVQLALSFQLHAHEKIDEFVLRHAPSLKGTETGVDVYVKAKQQQQEQQKQSQGQEQPQRRPGSSRSSNQDGNRTAASTPPPVAASATSSENKAAATTAGLPPRAAVATVVNHVTPAVQPTALQPVFATPEVLRRRLVEDHIHRETLRARLVHAVDDKSKDGDSQDGNKPTAPTFQPALSCRAVLAAFAVSVRNFYRAQRERQDFENPFEYPRQEEQLYLDCITLIEQQFERIFLHALLYEREKADVYDRSAAKAVWQFVANGDAASAMSVDSGSGGNRCCCCWLDEAHLCYLVRFLQHFPQLMGLASATVAQPTTNSTPAPGAANAKPDLHITRVAKGVIEKFAKITEEFLVFIAQYEQKVLGAGEAEEAREE